MSCSLFGAKALHSLRSGKPHTQSVCCLNSIGIISSFCVGRPEFELESEQLHSHESDEYPGVEVMTAVTLKLDLSPQPLKHRADRAD
jgi:hypothetical protein